MKHKNFQLSTFNFQLKKSFTLLEVIVVIAVISLVLPLLISLLFSVFRQQAKIYALNQVKKEGDNALDSMETTIRNNAVGVYFDTSLSTKECTTAVPTYSSNGGGNFYFKDKTGQWFQFSLSGNSILSSSQILPSGVALTSSTVKIIDPKTGSPSFTISCSKSSAYSPTIITITYTVTFGSTSSAVEDFASFPYQLSIALRNEE